MNIKRLSGFLVCTLIALAILSALILGRDNLGYYWHLAKGQIRILAERRSINELIENPATPETLKDHLQLVKSVTRFAEKELKLDAENQFKHYVDLDRPHAVWNVYAAPRFSISPKTWCFPLAGCTVYKGFFSLERAERQAEKLRKQGYDVHISPADGYSTLGWFSDPIFRNILERGEPFVASYIFHELAHKKIYIKDDTRFNEGFAVAVEQEGVRRWLESTDRQGLFKQYIRRLRRRDEFVSLMHKTRAGLSELYEAGQIGPAEKRKRKQFLFRQMQADYMNMKAGWDNYAAYDKWFATPLNNARFIPAGTYYELVPAFSGIIKASGGNMEIFYALAKALAEKPRQHRNLLLRVYAGINFAPTPGPKGNRLFSTFNHTGNLPESETDDKSTSSSSNYN